MKSALLVTGVMMVLVAGCGEDKMVELHSPGEYQGAPDPLLDVAGTPKQEQRLQERLRQVQTDR